LIKNVYVPNPDKNTRFRILEVHTKGKPIGRDIDLMKIAEMTNGFSGAEVSAVVNTAISLVLHEYLQKFPSPEEVAKHTSDVVVSHNISKRQSKRKRNKEKQNQENQLLVRYITGRYNNFREQNILYDGKFEREREP
jgi:transitional endoplasmic reticulum ATPase